MVVEIICIGTEILIGDIVNTNAHYLSSQLADIGYDVYFQTAVGDNEDRIKKSLDIAFSRSDIVITTGGLGPTADDMTKRVCASYFKKELIFDESVLNNIENMTLCKDNLNDAMKSQAYIPKDVVVLKNDCGTAPGCIFDQGDKKLIILPGPPKEMMCMYDNYVKPYLKSKSDSVILSNSIKICGMGESQVESKLAHLMDSKNPTLALYITDGQVRLRISCKDKNHKLAQEKIDQIKTKVSDILGEYIYAYDDENIQDIVCEELIQKNITISLAESCTGGLLASTLVSYPGISKVFKEGIVCYSNESKIKRLGVNSKSIEKYTQVSEIVAKEMAIGCAKLLNTDIAISTTGVAGPDDMDEFRKKGLVYVGIYIKGSVKVEKLNLFGDREKIRNWVVVRCLDILRQELKKI